MPSYSTDAGRLESWRRHWRKGRDVTGSEALRRHASFRTNIANGDFVAVARLLNTTNIGTVQPSGEIINGGLLRSSGLFPENFIVTNPQFSAVTLRTNSDSSIYHSLQTQLTVRPKQGVTYQATYTWSRSLGIVTSGARDLWDRAADYTRLSSDRMHDFRSYGTFELPFGPSKLLGCNSSGLLARVIEGWRTGHDLQSHFGRSSEYFGNKLSLCGGGAGYRGEHSTRGTGCVAGGRKHFWRLLPGTVSEDHRSRVQLNRSKSSILLHEHRACRFEGQCRLAECEARNSRLAGFADDRRAGTMGKLRKA